MQMEEKVLHENFDRVSDKYVDFNSYKSEFVVKIYCYINLQKKEKAEVG